MCPISGRGTRPSTRQTRFAASCATSTCAERSPAVAASTRHDVTNPSVHVQLDPGFLASPILLAASALVAVLLVVIALVLLPVDRPAPMTSEPAPFPCLVLLASGLG